MFSMKYILVEHEDEFNGRHLSPVMFPQSMIHKDVFNGLRFTMRIRKVVSAGFVNVVEDMVETVGRSESLDVDSRPEDAQLIERLTLNTNSTQIFGFDG